MSPADLKGCADMLRWIAVQIEAGKWGSVNVQIDNEHVDKPRTWRNGGQFRGKDLVGRRVTVDLAMPCTSGGEE